jgi:alginate O-acetyltransferase complex protein AlgI
MSFGSILFPIFLFAVYAGVAVCRRQASARLLVLLFASALFFVPNLPFDGLWLLGLALFGYLATTRISAAAGPGARAAWFYGYVTVCIGVLVCFKLNVASPFTASSPAAWVLPLGLSYYLFQGIGNAIDVYRARRAPVPLLRYLTSLSFFPCLAAGPILKLDQTVPQLEAPTPLVAADAKMALFQICNGFFKKTVADLAASFTVAYFQGTPTAGSAVALWAAVLGLSVQFYADFSGYSDIAMGTARLIGVRVPNNFDLPYLAPTVAEHWRRWHVSLTDWFREYVFLPLSLRLTHPLRARLPNLGGGSITALCVLVTFALIGLWHGCGWNLLLWGLFNGVFVASSPGLARALGRSRVAQVTGISITFLLIALGRVFFVTDQPLITLEIWHAMLVGTFSDPPSADLLALILMLVGLVVPHAVDYAFLRKEPHLRESPLTWLLMTILLAAAIGLSAGRRPFLYMGF